MLMCWEASEKSGNVIIPLIIHGSSSILIENLLFLCHGMEGLLVGFIIAKRILRDKTIRFFHMIKEKTIKNEVILCQKANKNGLLYV